MNTTSLMLNVSDLKQYLYCHRVVWYRYCQPVPRPVTYKMDEGRLVGMEEGERERRRSLRAYGLSHGERSFELWLESEKLGLCGSLDMLIKTENERIPVEFKNAISVAVNHRYQLAAYTLLLEETNGPPIERGFIYLIPSKRAAEVRVTAGIRLYVTRTLNEMRRMILEESYPAPTRVRSRHTDCEFRPYCQDVD
jgi:CRISPR-associated exonuclease Cas4